MAPAPPAATTIRAMTLDAKTIDILSVTTATVTTHPAQEGPGLYPVNALTRPRYGAAVAARGRKG
jgi:hypothetical protein